MNSDWLNFLVQSGVVPAAEGISLGAAPQQALRAALSGDILCDLAAYGLIAATGADTQTFLQGQLSSDVRQVTAAHSQLSAYCNPQGRILASLRLFRRGDAYYIRMPRERVESILQRLRMFVLRAKVTLRDASDELVQIGLAGPSTGGLLQHALGAAPAQVDEVVHTADLTAIRVHGPAPRFEIYGGVEPVKALWTRLASQVTPAATEPWRLLDIVAGVPTIYTATAAMFVPQMVNLQLLGGVSFRKGCYAGQEIIARTQHLGKLKRRMYRIHVDSALAPQAGDELCAAHDAGQSIAQIVDACPHPEGGYEVLAVVLIECVENSTVLLGNAQLAKLEFAPLPYAFEDVGA